MELHQLTYLDAVVRHGGFTRAAEDLHVAQPAVSVAVRRLEAELGVTLLTRGRGAPAPTEAGEVFLRPTDPGRPRGDRPPHRNRPGGWLATLPAPSRSYSGVPKCL